MTEERSVFVTRPVPVVLQLEDGGVRRAVARRMNLAHAPVWNATWFGFTPAWVDFSEAEKRAFAIAIIKAGYPEPIEEFCSPVCICRGNEGLHDLVDALAAAENFGPLDVLFEAALEVNRPKGQPPIPAAPAGDLTSTRSLPAWSSWAFDWPIARIFRSRSLHIFLTTRSAIAQPGTPPSPPTPRRTWHPWRRSSTSSASAPAPTSRPTSKRVPRPTAAERPASR